MKAASSTPTLRADDIPDDIAPWLVVSGGEGVQPFQTRAEAVAAAKEQADAIPNLVLGVYRLEHFVAACVLPAALFAPTAVIGAKP